MRLEFAIKRGVVNANEIEDEDIKGCVSKSIELIRLGNLHEAVAALPPLSFEWSWSGGDGDPGEIFEHYDDIDTILSPDNSRVRLGEDRGNLVISANIVFDVEIKIGIDRDYFQNWLEENSMSNAGYISGGWSYHSDDGTSIAVL